MTTHLPMCPFRYLPPALLCFSRLPVPSHNRASIFVFSGHGTHRGSVGEGSARRLERLGGGIKFQKCRQSAG